MLAIHVSGATGTPFSLMFIGRSYFCHSHFLTLRPSLEFDMALGEQAVNRGAHRRFSTACQCPGLILETIGAF